MALSAAALQVIVRQVGHITSTQLVKAGTGRTSRARLVHDGVFDQPYKSVYRVATKRPTFEQRLVALSLAHSHGFITGPTLGGYLGVRRMPKASKIHFCMPHPCHVVVPIEVHLRQSTAVTARDRRQLDNSMWVASWPRLLFDLAADLPRRNLLSAIEQVVAEQHATLDDLGAIARRLCHPRRHGSELFAKVLMDRGLRPAVESDPELAVLEGLLARGVPVVPQHQMLHLPNGKSVRIDLAVPDARWGVELDIHPRHGEPWGSARDLQRDRQLHRLDWQVDHIVPVDLLVIEQVLDELAANYFARIAHRPAA